MIKDRLQAAFDALPEGNDVTLPSLDFDAAIKKGFGDFLSLEQSRQFLTEFAMVHRMSMEGEYPSRIEADYTVSSTDGLRYELTVTVSCKELPSNG